MPRGRKPKLTPEVQKIIVDAIAGGNYNDIAADYAGVGRTTFYRWMEKGEEAASGIYRDFWDAVKKASAQAEVRNVTAIERDPSWQAKAWWLERKHNDRWGRKERHELTGADGGPVAIDWAGAIQELEADKAAAAEK